MAGGWLVFCAAASAMARSLFFVLRTLSNRLFGEPFAQVGDVGVVEPVHLGDEARKVVGVLREELLDELAASLIVGKGEVDGLVDALGAEHGRVERGRIVDRDDDHGLRVRRLQVLEQERGPRRPRRRRGPDRSRR